MGDVLTAVGLVGAILALVAMAGGVFQTKVYPDATRLFVFVPVTRLRYGQMWIRASLGGLTVSTPVLVAGLLSQQRWAYSVAALVVLGGTTVCLWSYWIDAGLVSPRIAKWRDERRMIRRIAERQAGPTRAFHAPD